MTGEFSERFKRLGRWQPPAQWNEITVIDAHTEGEPLRIICGGYPDLSGGTMLERRRSALHQFDSLRTALMWEPRGHADMYGCVITPPVSEAADFGVLFLHNEGYSTMCGHGIIAVTRVVLETGMVPFKRPRTRVVIDTPAGLVTAWARVEGDAIRSIYFHNVPSFVAELDVRVEVDGLGTIAYDLAFGGAFYAYVDVDQVGLSCTPANFRQLIDYGMRIKRSIMNNRRMGHPFEAELDFLYGTIFVGPAESGDHHSRNVCIFAEGEVDRSPTGTGVSGRMAIHHAKGEVGIGQAFIIESIIGSTFTASIAERCTFGPYEAIIPQVEGTAYITGINRYLIDPDDPLRKGFILR